MGPQPWLWLQTPRGPTYPRSSQAEARSDRGLLGRGLTWGGAGQVRAASPGPVVLSSSAWGSGPGRSLGLGFGPHGLPPSVPGRSALLRLALTQLGTRCFRTNMWSGSSATHSQGPGHGLDATPAWAQRCSERGDSVHPCWGGVAGEMAPRCVSALSSCGLGSALTLLA